MKPGPRYDALAVYLQPEIEQARRAGHFPNLVAAFKQLYEAHVADCPAAYSPRISDVKYRQAVVEYHAMRDAARRVDSIATSLEAKMDQVARTMFYVQRPEGRFVRPDRFFAVLNEFLPLQARLDDLLRASGAITVHPDAPPPVLLHKIGQSAFVQSWMPMLDHDTGLKALEATGLADQYEELAEVPIHGRPCPKCGVDVPVVEGAHAVLCEACGTLVGGEAHAVRCGGCGGGFTPDPSQRELACPWCRRVVDVTNR